MTIFLFSLAGIPPLAGWFAKFVMFRVDASTPAPAWGDRARASSPRVNSVIAFFYYSRVVAQDVVRRSPPTATTARRSGCRPRSTRRDRASRAAVVVVVGVYPQLFARVGELAVLSVGGCDRAAAPTRSPSASTARARSRSTRSSSSRSTSRGRLLRTGRAAPGAPGATSSPAPRSARCSARAWPRALDRWWARARRARPVRRGRGRRRARPARARRAARRARRARAALRYVLVERSAGAARRAARRCSPLEPRRRGARARSCAATPTTRRCRSRGTGPVVAVARRAPGARRSTAWCSPTSCSTTCRSGSSSGTARGWDEVRVGAPTATRFVEVLVPAEPTTLRALEADRRGRDVPRRRAAAGPARRRRRGSRRARPRAAPRRARASIDYVDDAAGAASRAAAGLAAHLPRRTSAASTPLDAPGEQDITADVVRRAARARGRRAPGSRSSATSRRPSGCATSASTTRRRRAARTWDDARRTSATSRRSAGRSRVAEAAALTDPAGLGAHRVVVVSRAADAASSSADSPADGRRTERQGGGAWRTTLEALLAGGPHVPAARGVPQGRARHRRDASTTRPSATGRASGPTQALALDWDAASGTRSSSGTCRSPKWFVGGKLNVSYNCLDRHVDAGHGDQVAFYWEGEPGDTRTDHLRASCSTRRAALANALQGARRREGRPGRDLHGHGARAADRDARVRAHRRAALGGVRRLHRRLAARPHQRRRGQGARSPADGAWRRGARRRR